MNTWIVSHSLLYDVSFIDYTLREQLRLVGHDNTVNLCFSGPRSASQPRKDQLVALTTSTEVVDMYSYCNRSMWDGLSISCPPGYASVHFAAGLLVVLYSDRVEVHSKPCGQVQKTAVLTFSTGAQQTCFTNVKGRGGGACFSLRGTSAGRDSSKINDSLGKMEASLCSVEWITVDVAALSELLAAGETVDVDGDNGRMQQEHEEQSYSVLGACWAVPTPLLAACSAGLPGVPELEDLLSESTRPTDIWCVAYGAIARSALRRFACWQEGSSSRVSTGTGMTTLVAAVTTTAQLLCCADGTLVLSRSLPLGPILVREEVNLQLTSSVQAPLLLLSKGSRLLLLDVLDNGVILREFTHVGAYILAPLLDTWSQQLLVLPESEVRGRGIQSIAHGHVLVKVAAEDSNPDTTGTESIPYNSSSNNDHSYAESSSGPSPHKKAKFAKNDSAGLGLANWFVYELPTQAHGAACRSMDPHGLWRIDSNLVVDAEAYNCVQWQRVVVVAEQQTTSSVGAKDEASAGGDDNREHDKPSVPSGHRAAGNMSSSSSNSSGSSDQHTTPGTAVPRRDRSGLISQLTAHLGQIKEELQLTAAVGRHKKASSNLLRSLAVSPALARGVRQVPVPQEVKEESGGGSGGQGDRQGYFLEIQQPALSKNHYVKDLRAAEKALVRSQQQKPAGQEEVVDDEIDLGVPIEAAEVDSCDTKGALCVESLHYRCVPHTTSIEVFAVVRNVSADWVTYDVHLAAYGAVSHSVRALSGRVNCLQPGERVCISALVQIPQSAFLAEKHGCVAVRVVLSCRMHVLSAGVGADAAALLPEEVMTADLCSVSWLRVTNNLTSNRVVSRIVGVVHVDASEAYRSYQGSPTSPSELQKLRQRHLWAKYHLGGGAVPGVLVAQSGLPNLRHSSSEASAGVISTHSYAASLHVTLQSPLSRSAHLQRLLSATARVITLSAVQELRSALDTASGSTFCMDQVLSALQAAVAGDGGFGGSLLAIDPLLDCDRAGAVLQWSTPMSCPIDNASRTGASRSAAVEALSVKEVWARCLQAVQRSGVLRCSPFAAAVAGAQPVIVLANALLQLRRLLPLEVSATAGPTGVLERSAAIRCACLSMLQELSTAKFCQHDSRAIDSGARAVVDMSKATQSSSTNQDEWSNDSITAVRQRVQCDRAMVVCTPSKFGF